MEWQKQNRNDDVDVDVDDEVGNYYDCNNNPFNENKFVDMNLL